MFDKKKYGYLLILSTLIFGLLLILDVYLTTHGREGLCSSSGCKVASSLINIRESFLILTGAALYLILFLLFFFQLRYPAKKILYHIPWLLLLGAISFDGVLIGFLIKTKTLCYLCLSMGASLFFVLALYSVYQKKILSFFLGIVIWTCSFSAIYLLKTQSVRIPPMVEGRMIHIFPTNGLKFRANLFISLHCIHCYHVLYNLAHLKRSHKVEWNIYFLAKSREDKLKIAHMLMDKEIKKYPFRVILKYRNMEKISPIPVPSYIDKRLKATQKFFMARGFEGVPVLIATTPSVEISIVGVTEIAKFLLQEKVVKKWYFFRNPTPPPGD